LSTKITDIVIKILEPILKKNQLELYNIEFTKEGANWYLRIYIDKEEGFIDLEECSRINGLLSKKLDEIDPIPYPYFLEVSSPGAERLLKTENDFKKFIGFNIVLILTNQTELQGKLKNYKDKLITIEKDNKDYEISLNDIETIKTVVVF